MTNDKKEALLDLLSDELNQIIDSEEKLNGKFQVTKSRLENWIIKDSNDGNRRLSLRQKLICILMASSAKDEDDYDGPLLTIHGLGDFLKTTRLRKSREDNSVTGKKAQDSEDFLEKQLDIFEDIIKGRINRLVDKLKKQGYEEFGDSKNAKSYLEGSSFEQLVGILYVHAMAGECYSIEKKPDYLPGITYIKDEMNHEIDFSKQVYYVLCSEDVGDQGFWRWYSNFGLPDNMISVWLDDVGPGIFESDDKVGDLIRCCVLDNRESNLFREANLTFIPYENNDYLTNLKMRIESNKKIVIFMEYKDDLLDFFSFLNSTKPVDLPQMIYFVVLIPDGSEVNMFSHVEKIRYIPRRLTEDEMSEIFWKCCKTRESNSEVDELITKIYRIVFNDRILMGCIGEAYGEYYNQAGSAEAVRLLKEIVSSQTEYNKISVTKTKENEKGIIKYHSKIKINEQQDPGRTITQVLKNKYQTILEDGDRQTLLLLSCLSGWALPEKNYQKWFGIKEECFNRLKKKGWIKEGNIKIELKNVDNSYTWLVKEEKDFYSSVPVFLATSLYTEEEAKRNYDVVYSALDSLLKEVRSEDEIDMDPEVLLFVFQRLMAYLSRWAYKTKDKKEHDEKIYRLQIAAIRLFIENRYYDDAFELLMEMPPRHKNRLEAKALLGVVKFRSTENGRPKFTDNKELFEIEDSYFEDIMKKGHINRLTRESAEILFFTVDSIVDYIFWRWANYMAYIGNKERREFFYENWFSARNMLNGYIDYYGMLYCRFRFTPSSGTIGQQPGYYLLKYLIFSALLELYMHPNPVFFKLAVDNFFAFIRIVRILPDADTRKCSDVRLQLYMDNVIISCLMSDLIAVNNKESPLLNIKDQNLCSYKGFGDSYHCIINEIIRFSGEIGKIQKTYPIYMSKRFSPHLKLMDQFMDNILDHGTMR